MTTAVKSWAHTQADAYRHGEDRPLGGYLGAMGVYGGATALGEVLARVLRRPSPSWSPWEVTQLALATHKLSRLIAKDAVTSPLRAPFNSFEEAGAPGEVNESVRAHSAVGHSLGELLSCPFCLAPWIAGVLSTGLVLAPRPTRKVLATFVAVAGSDFLQYVYALGQKASGE